MTYFFVFCPAELFCALHLTSLQFEAFLLDKTSYKEACCSCSELKTKNSEEHLTEKRKMLPFIVVVLPRVRPIQAHRILVSGQPFGTVILGQDDPFST